jgi:hypothetical protein
MGALSIISAAWSFASSRVGLAAIAGALCFAWGHHRASSAYEAREAAREAAALRAQIQERARQATAADAIAAQDRQRAQAAAGAAAAMQAEIDRLQTELAAQAAANRKKDAPYAQPKPKTVVVDACALDTDFARRVRRLDAAGKR